MQSSHNRSIQSSDTCAWLDKMFYLPFLRIPDAIEQKPEIWIRQMQFLLSEPICYTLTTRLKQMDEKMQCPNITVAPKALVANGPP
jgi:hypothetical protein